jgi:HEAT repeat protein
VIAALLLGYAPDKAAVVPDLEAAVLDSDAGVRNNATRALALIAHYASAHPELGIEIDPAPFVTMLNSGSWSDRNKGLAVLGTLTASRDPALIDALKSADTLPALIEMCRWQSPSHSYLACRLLERVVGLPEQPELHPKEQTLALAVKLR